MFRQFAIFSIAAGIIGAFVNSIRKKRILVKNKKVVNEVLFFPDKEFPCLALTKIVGRSKSNSTCTNLACRRLHGRVGEPPSSMIKFLNYIAGAKKSVDLCIYIFTQATMAELLSGLHALKVRVRVITDVAEDEAMSSQIERLRRAGIEIRSNRRGTGALMHHKFVIIDRHLLISGSFNWTNKAVVSNYEAVLVTSMESLVEPFINKFDEMWSEFNEHQATKPEFN